MANFEIPENLEYIDEIRKLEETDPAHANLFNEIFQQLINNEKYLKNNKADTSNPVFTGSFSHNRLKNTEVGMQSVTLGWDSTATGVYSVAIGPFSKAIGKSSISMGFSSIAKGDYAVATGVETQAQGPYSFAAGAFNTASGSYSHVEGEHSTASGTTSHAEGSTCTASGTWSHAEGNASIARGKGSHAEGNCTKAIGEWSHAGGYWTNASDCQYAIGHYNNTTLATPSVNNGVSGGTAFVIGNGTGSAPSNACRITDDGAVIGKKAYQASGADYAERKEWVDGNPDAEDRRGYFVTMDGDKIKIASPGDFILGVISANPCIVGNNDEGWRGQFLLDEFGDFIMEEIEITDEVTGETRKSMFYKVNPDYDSNKPYIHRKDRKEWDCVGMLGFLATRDDGTCRVNGYCTVAAGGIATVSENGYRVVERINDNLVKILFR